MKSELLHSLFHDILDHGSVHIRKAKLLWMLGRMHETPSVWDMVMREWRAFGQSRALYGFHSGDEVTLALAPGESIAETWTTRREEPRFEVPRQLTLVS